MARLTLSETTRNTTTTTTASRWQDIPCDVLIEIFLESLPTDPLRHKQPDVTLAPMLLCHICSYWRHVALSVPQLWESLYHVSSVVDSREPTADLLRTGIRSKDIHFLRWWTNNLGLKSPILRLRLNWSQDEDEPGAEAEDQGPFFKTLLSSPKYLDPDPTYTTALHSWTRASPWMYPNLNTLVLRSSTSQDTRTIPMVRAHTRPLRRLHLEGFTFPTPASLNAVPWANLTHATMLSLSIPLATWFHLIRSLTSLLSDSFHITSLDAIQTLSPPFHPPPLASLPLLHTLYLSFPSTRIYTPEISQILLALSLASLLRLRLTAPTLPLFSLHAILLSTPALTHLHLGGRVPVSWAPAHLPQHQFQLQFHADGTPVPFCRFTPHLTHILLDSSLQTNDMLPVWVSSILCSRWLGLRLRHHRPDPDPDPTAPAPIPSQITHIQLAIHPLATPTNAHHTGRPSESTPAHALLAFLTDNGWAGANPGFSKERSSHVLQNYRACWRAASSQRRCRL